ncbi:MAG: CSLREA domain-containing protein [Pirellulales bacterium]
MLTITVNTLFDDIDGSINDGTVSLRDAIAAAAPGETIDFSVTGTLQLDPFAVGSVLIEKSLVLEGPGAGALTIAGPDFDRLFTVSDSSPALIDVEIRGLTLTGGNAQVLPSGLGFDRSGGAILSDENLTIADSVIAGNVAVEGGGVASRYGNLTIINTTVSNNVGVFGGGIYSVGESLIIQDSETSGNTAVLGGGGFVVGLATIESSLFSGNEADGGGGLFLNGGDLSITGSTFAGNMANGGDGGGVSAAYSSLASGEQELTITNSTFESNSSDSSGGGLALTNIPASIEGSTFVANSALSGGGTHVSGNSALEVVSSTFSANTANDDGGALATNGSGFGVAIEVRHSTLVDNIANSDGVDGGVGGAIYAGASSYVTLGHTIVADNLTGGAPSDIQGPVRLSFSLLESAAGASIVDLGGNLLGISPQLGPLANNGGATQTHAPLAGSPAINMGDPGFSPPPSVDQTGAARVVLGRVDIGAVEFVDFPTGPYVVDTNADELDFDLTPGDVSLREAIALQGFFGGNAPITFAPSMSGTTIALMFGPLEITSDVTINGPGEGLLTIDGRGESRVFTIDDGDSGIDRDVAISGVTITGGLADGAGSSGWGGGVLSREDLTLTGVSIEGNVAQTSGGGVRSDDGSLTLIESSVLDNVATVDSAGGVFAGAPLTVIRSTIAGNRAGLIGGGLLANGQGATLIENSTVSGNTAAVAGGASLNGGATLRHATITNNTITNPIPAPAQASGLLASSNVTLDHVIIAGNIDVLSLAGDVSQTTLVEYTARYSLIGDGSDANIVDNGGNLIGTDISPIDAKLLPLAANGGSTLTHTLSPDSPALNAGDPGFSGPPNTDQRGIGFPRAVFGQIDIGAVEFNPVIPATLVVDSTDDTVDGNFSAGQLTLREAVLLANLNSGLNTIEFAPSIHGQTIEVSAGELLITSFVNIEGPGPDLLTLTTENASRLLRIDDGTPNEIFVTISGVTLTRSETNGAGDDGRGGAILSREGLYVIDCVLSENEASGDGGAIASLAASLTVENTAFEFNQSGGRGGAIVGHGVTAVVSSTLSQNTGGFGGVGFHRWHRHG